MFLNSFILASLVTVQSFNSIGISENKINLNEEKKLKIKNYSLIEISKKNVSSLELVKKTTTEVKPNSKINLIEKPKDIIETRKREAREKIEEERKLKEKAEKERLAVLQLERKKAEALRRQKAVEQEKKKKESISTGSGQNNVLARIKHWSDFYGVDYSKAISIAQCESGLDSNATSSNGLYAGVYQQDKNFWPNRAANAGVAGADVYNAEANIRVSIWMMATDGFGHWPVCGR